MFFKIIFSGVPHYRRDLPPLPTKNPKQKTKQTYKLTNKQTNKTDHKEVHNTSLR